MPEFFYSPRKAVREEAWLGRGAKLSPSIWAGCPALVEASQSYEEKDGHTESCEAGKDFAIKFKITSRGHKSRQCSATKSHMCHIAYSIGLNATLPVRPNRVWARCFHSQVHDRVYSSRRCELILQKQTRAKIDYFMR